MELPDILEPYRARIESTLRPCLEVSAAPGVPGDLDSRIGGPALLPSDMPYPHNAKGRPLRFLAQLNFADMPPRDGLPRRGLLQFYLEDTGLYGVDYARPTVQDGFRLLYFAEPPSPPYLDLGTLERPTPQRFPLGAKATGLLFRPALMPVTGSDYRCSALDLADFKTQDAYSEAFSGDGHRVLGYPGFEQDDPREESETLQAYELLLQLDSDDALGMMWGDMGTATFLIRPEALETADFSDVLFYWDCG